MAKSNKEKQADFKKRQIALGFVRKSYYVTPREDEFLKTELRNFRLRSEVTNETN